MLTTKPKKGGCRPLIRNRRKSRARGLPATLTAEQWRSALAHFANCCAVCGRCFSTVEQSALLTIDHWTPHDRGGGTTADNILPLCQGCNNSKDNHEPLPWLIERFGQVEGQQIAQRIEHYFEGVRQAGV